MEVLRISIQGKFPTVLKYLEGKSVGRRGICVQGSRISRYYLKRLESKLKKKISTENKEQNLNLKRTEIITYMRGVVPLSIALSLFYSLNFVPTL